MYGQQPSPHAYPASPPSYQMKRQCSYTHSTPTPIHPPVDGMSRSASYFPSSEHRPYSPPTPPMDMSSQQKVSLPPISHLMSLVGSSASHQQRPRVEIPKFHTVPAEYHATPKEVLPPTPPMTYNGIGSTLAQQSSGSRLSPLPSEHSRPLVREQRLSMASESSAYSAVSNRSRSPASVSTPASALSSAYSDSYHRPSAYQPQSVLGKRPTPVDFHPARDLPVPMQHPRSPESRPASASTSPMSTHKHLDTETHSVSTGASSPNSQFVPSERYLCQQCNKAFSRPSSLRIHSHSHTGEKPYKCPHKSCGKAFSVRSNMKRHEKGCHAEERDRLMEMMGNSRPAERELLPAAAA